MARIDIGIGTPAPDDQPGGDPAQIATSTGRQLSRYRHDYPEGEIMRVVANYGDGTFDLDKPGLGSVYRRVVSINPRATQGIPAGATVSVRFYDVNRSRAYIKGVSPLFMQPGEEVVDPPWNWPDTFVRRQPHFGYPPRGPIIGGETLADRVTSAWFTDLGEATTVPLFNTEEPVLGLVAYLVNNERYVATCYVDQGSSNALRVKCIKRSDASVLWDVTFGSGYCAKSTTVGTPDTTCFTHMHHLKYVQEIHRLLLIPSTANFFTPSSADRRHIRTLDPDTGALLGEITDIEWEIIFGYQITSGGLVLLKSWFAGLFHDSASELKPSDSSHISDDLWDDSATEIPEEPFLIGYRWSPASEIYAKAWSLDPMLLRSESASTIELGMERRALPIRPAFTFDIVAVLGINEGAGQFYFHLDEQGNDGEIDQEDALITAYGEPAYTGTNTADAYLFRHHDTNYIHVFGAGLIDGKVKWQETETRTRGGNLVIDTVSFQDADTLSASFIDTFGNDDSTLPASTEWLPDDTTYRSGLIDELTYEVPGGGIAARYDPDYDEVGTSWCGPRLLRTSLGDADDVEQSSELGGSTDLGFLNNTGPTFRWPYYKEAANGAIQTLIRGGEGFLDGKIRVDGNGSLYYIRSWGTTTIEWRQTGEYGVDTDATMGFWLVKQWAGTKSTTIGASPHVEDRPVKDFISTPPGSPSVLDLYIVKPTGTGAWSGQDNNFAEWNGASWDFESPLDYVVGAGRDDSRFAPESTKTPIWSLLTDIGSTFVFFNPNTQTWDEGRSASDPIAEDPTDFRYELFPHWTTGFDDDPASNEMIKRSSDGTLVWQKTITELVGPDGTIFDFHVVGSCLILLAADDDVPENFSLIGVSTFSGDVLWREDLDAGGGFTCVFSFVDESDGNPYLFEVLQNAPRIIADDGTTASNTILRIKVDNQGALLDFQTGDTSRPSKDPGPYTSMAVYDEAAGELLYPFFDRGASEKWEICTMEAGP